MTRTVRFARALGLLAALGWLGCAPAAPILAGGQTTPADRLDLGLGGAFRAPVADLAPSRSDTDALTEEEEMLRFAQPGGLAPVGWARWGIDEVWDLGLMASSSLVRVELRGESIVLPAYGARVMWGLVPYGGYARGDGAAEGWRVGGLAPLGVGAALGSIIEAWGGVRVGFEHVEGWLGQGRPAASANAFRAGAFFGLAVGFRRVHALVELVLDYEYWGIELGTNSLERQGLVVTPGWALRLRF